MTPQQDIKDRYFDKLHNMLWWKEHHISSGLQPELGLGLGYMFHNNLGIQTDFFYNRSDLSGTMEGSKLGKFDMEQERYNLLLSLVKKIPIHALGLSSIYGSCGLGAVYTNYSYLPDEWGLAGQFSLGTDLSSSQFYNLFVEFKYTWHQDVGDNNQGPGENLKTSGNPSWNLASHIIDQHHDTQVIGLMFGTRFKFQK